MSLLVICTPRTLFIVIWRATTSFCTTITSPSKSETSGWPPSSPNGRIHSPLGSRQVCSTIYTYWRGPCCLRGDITSMPREYQNWLKSKRRISSTRCKWWNSTKTFLFQTFYLLVQDPCCGWRQKWSKSKPRMPLATKATFTPSESSSTNSWPEFCLTPTEGRDRMGQFTEVVEDFQLIR